MTFENASIIFSEVFVQLFNEYPIIKIDLENNSFEAGLSKEVELKSQKKPRIIFPIDFIASVTEELKDELKKQIMDIINDILPKPFSSYGNQTIGTLQIEIQGGSFAELIEDVQRKAENGEIPRELVPEILRNIYKTFNKK